MFRLQDQGSIGLTGAENEWVLDSESLGRRQQPDVHNLCQFHICMEEFRKYLTGYSSFKIDFWFNYHEMTASLTTPI